MKMEEKKKSKKHQIRQIQAFIELLCAKEHSNEKIVPVEVLIVKYEEIRTFSMRQFPSFQMILFRKVKTPAGIREEVLIS